MSESPAVAWNGRSWKVGRPTGRAREILEELAAGQAAAEVTALKRAVDPATYREMLADLRHAVAAREYATWGDGWQRIVFAADGSGGRLFLLSLLRLAHADATPADAAGLLDERPDEVDLALDAVMPDFFRLLADHPRVPKDRREKVAADLAENYRQARAARGSATSGTTPATA